MGGDLNRKLVEEVSDIATIIDADGTITYVSPSVSRLGYEPEELIGEVGYEYQHPEDRETVADAIDRLLTTETDRELVETRFRRADGSWCWIEASLQDRMDDPDIEGILLNSRDISERKAKEKQYQALAEEYTALLDTVEDGIFFVNVETTAAGHEFRFERLNQAYEEQTGITTEEVQGKTPAEVFGDELGTELQSNYHRCANAKEPIRYQEEVPVETGARFWQTNLAPVVTDGTVTQIIGITRNVTERVKRERQLRKQKEQLEEFAGVVSHDLRNPLGVAQARAELLAEECTSEHLDPVVQSLDRMEVLITDTLTLARQGQVVADTESLTLVNLVGSCWKNVSTDQANIEIEDKMRFRGDRSRLQHVFENLFRNAVDHGMTDSQSSATGSGEGSELTVRVGQLGENGIYVEDNGPGIPPERREEVFGPGNTSTRGGTGFGLTIVKRIAEAHGWRVRITEGSAGGARFEFTGVEIE